MGKLVLIRHGTTVAGEQSIYSGTLDFPLSHRGVQQVIRKAALYPDLNYDAAFVSQLTRAVETASLFFAAKGYGKLPLFIDEGARNEIPNPDGRYLLVEKCAALNERNYGDLQGKSKSEALAIYGAEELYRFRRGFYGAPPNGERFADVVDRVRAFYEVRLKPLRDKTVLVVAHQNTLRALCYQIENFDETTAESVEFNNVDGVIYTFCVDNPPIVERITESAGTGEKTD